MAYSFCMLWRKDPLHTAVLAKLMETLVHADFTIALTYRTYGNLLPAHKTFLKPESM